MIEKLQENQNNEQQDYKILTLLRPQKHYSTALSEKKKKETVILHNKLCRQHRATEGSNEMTRKALMKNKYNYRVKILK